MAQSPHPLLELKDIAKLYTAETVATPALQGVSFSIEKGDFVSIMGASGSGKSTLLHILGLLDRPTSGQFLLDGQDTALLSDETRAHIRNSQIGFIFQAFHLLPRADVLQNVMLPLQYSSTPSHEHKKLALAALEKVEMSHRLNHKPSELSGGEKQRTVIARALVNQPTILFADEPTGNLDSRTGQTVMEVIDSLHNQGLTVLVITHETPTARFAKRIITLKDGQLSSDKQVDTSEHKFTK